MIEIETHDGVRLLRLARPSRRNALDSASIHALRDALAAAEHDAACGAVVLAAAPPMFCAGSDLKELGGMDVPAMCAHEAETAAVARSIGLGTKPVVAAVEGRALGGGFVLAIACDLVVTASTTVWHLPEVPNGWLPPWGLQLLIARVGPVRARMLTWGAEPIDGSEALRLGVADFATPEGGALLRAQALATRLAGLPREAVASTKRIFQAAAAHNGEALDAEASRHFAENCRSAEARATLARFAARA